jgi:hypothetical protein
MRTGMNWEHSDFVLRISNLALRAAKSIASGVHRTPSPSSRAANGVRCTPYAEGSPLARRHSVSPVRASVNGPLRIVPLRSRARRSSRDSMLR